VPPTVRVDVLGPLRVTVDGAGVDVRPGSARILLAWLASQQGRRLRVDACARALYPQAQDH
jgi:DNA-binding SARP family transcriptional activator